MSFLALLALALGQQPCPHASKNCPQAQVQRCQEGRGCLVLAEAEDEIDMGEAEFLADPMDDQVIASAATKPNKTISVGLGFGKNRPTAVTVAFTKKDEAKKTEEKIQGQLFAFGPVAARYEVSVSDSAKSDKNESDCDKCPAAKAKACEKCPAVKANACAKCPAAQCDSAKACEKCPAVKASACAKCPAAQCDSAKACEKCPAVKASACAKCPAAQCDSAKAHGDCPACPAEQAVVQAPVTGEIVPAQAVTYVSTTATEQGKQARRRLFRRR